MSREMKFVVPSKQSQPSGNFISTFRKVEASFPEQHATQKIFGFPGRLPAMPQPAQPLPTSEGYGKTVSRSQPVGDGGYRVHLDNGNRCKRAWLLAG